MIITDLQYCENLNEELENINGGIDFNFFAKAEAAAEANAIGSYTFSQTGTLANAVAGLYSTSISYSKAEAGS